jgi:hypothetical protein
VTPNIHLAFRFHGSFYHSYRGDTPDELGFGKDIRIIRHLLATLDDLNARGVPLRGTWDFENYFSLEQIMPRHCPDLIASLQRRAAEGDEMQLMSYNNGLINGHTAREFEEAIRRGISNPNGSGLRDLFGDAFYPMVRPQEMMWTPVHLQMYRACGIDSVSLYYSALPFNGFSNFIPPLSFAQRYNPLILTYPGIEETMTLLPCYNTGDLADHLTLRRWIKQVRKEQLAQGEPADALLLIDMDADDEFWAGFDVPLLKGRFSTASGLRGLVENVADLDFVKWTTPREYLGSHPPVGTVSIGQDTADGSFDGFASWTEKWSNHVMWTGLDRARILDLQTRRLLGPDLPPDVSDLLDRSFEARLKILSTTHFGMAAPVMNLTREGIGRDLVAEAVTTAKDAFSRIAQKPLGLSFSLLDYARGESSASIAYPAKPWTGLIRLPVRKTAPYEFALRDANGHPVPAAIHRNGDWPELLFIDSFTAEERKDYSLEPRKRPDQPQRPVVVAERMLENERLKLMFDARGQLERVLVDGSDFALGRFLRSGITYAGKRYEVSEWIAGESASLGLVGVKELNGSVHFKDFIVSFEREIMLAEGLPYLYITTRVIYPRTPDKGYSRGKAERLQQAWDNDWQEVWPCEIGPALAGRPDSPLRVWKHNYCGHISRYDLDYGRFSKNVELDSANNHVMHGWVAVSDGSRGLLVGQTADVTSGMAPCPLRTRRESDALRVRLNPFGSYWGRQYDYAIADTGLGKLMAVTFSASDHIKPYAPSYNGRVQEFRLLIAPYSGDLPPESARNAALAFAYPPAVLNDDLVIADPPHRSWTGAGLGEPPEFD